MSLLTDAICSSISGIRALRLRVSAGADEVKTPRTALTGGQTGGRTAGASLRGPPRGAGGGRAGEQFRRGLWSAVAPGGQHFDRDAEGSN